MDHSKELDLKLPELYWSSFLDSVQKKTDTETEWPIEKNSFVCFRTEIESANENRLLITKLPLMVGKVFMEKKTSVFGW